MITVSYKVLSRVLGMGSWDVDFRDIRRNTWLR